MKVEVSKSWHPGIAPIAVFEDGREVFDIRRDADPLITGAAKWLEITRRLRQEEAYHAVSGGESAP